MLVLIASVSGDGCSRVQRELRYPCRCQQLPGAEGVEGDLVLDCNQVVFPGDFPALPYRAPVVSFSQRWVGHQNLPPQAFAQAGKYSLLSQCKKSHPFWKVANGLYGAGGLISAGSVLNASPIGVLT